MNTAPNQPPVPSAPKTSPINSPPTTTPAVVNTPPPTINPSPNTVVSTPINNSSPPTTNYQPPTNNFPPFVPPSGNQGNPPETVTTLSPHKKFPFMMITFFLVIVLAGFIGSYLFFSYNGSKSVKPPAQVVITPPVTLAPTQASENPFATASGDLGNNPFASPTAEINPSGTYQNPFESATISATPQPVTNPFQ